MSNLPNFGVNQALVEELYLKYCENPSSVEPSWQVYFESLTDDLVPPRRTASGKTAVGTTAVGIQAPVEPSRSFPPESGDRRSFIPGPETRAATELQSRVSQMVNAYRVRGHFYADLDPLGLAKKPTSELSLEAFGLGNVDIETAFDVGDMAAPTKVMSLKEIEGRLKETYCRTIGVEFTQIEDDEERTWLQTRMESTCNHVDLSRDEQLLILRRLTDAEVWETFVHNTWKTAKRFSAEGGESIIPMLDLITQKSAELGVEEVVYGMAHRGRLNVLVNVMGQPPQDLIAEFDDIKPQNKIGRGDVKYHLGYSSDRDFGGRKVHLTLCFNPSHLEFVNPVVEGRVRAKQDRRNDAARNAVLPVLIHGDAAFIGQGVVAETLNLSGLRGYHTGGTVHVVINNQIGFTTLMDDARSTPYCTDIARMLRCPVFHVNGEDPEAVAQVSRLAAEYRHRYKKDVCIDLYGYRKYGHNEGDEPRFTQPVMYQAIDKKKSVRNIYVEKLVATGFVTEADAGRIAEESRARLEKALAEVRETQREFELTAYTHLWAGYKGGPDLGAPDVSTAVGKGKLVELLTSLGTLPNGFQTMRQIGENVVANYLKIAASGTDIRWGVAENLAYATLLTEGHPIRITGQDSERGTFAHRHAVIYDSKSGERHIPLTKLSKDQARFEVYDSSLSESGVMGFEYGYSLDCPDGLVIWEAQFGDFANGAQVIIDQFVSSSEDKWHRLSGLVLLLPHGFEGAGPEHSSARLERFLALAAEDNIQVCNLTTSAQLFHVLRRQVKRPWRKPLVIMTPKSLLRAPEPASTLEDLSQGEFHRIIPDTTAAPKKVKRVVMCSGKIYYDLDKRRKEEAREDIAVIRLEQLYPIRPQEVRDVLAPYADGTDLVWAQEEPWNSGAWYFINARIPPMIDGRLPLRVIARQESASPATGSPGAHRMEQAEILSQVFAPTGKPASRSSQRPRADA